MSRILTSAIVVLFTTSFASPAAAHPFHHTLLPTTWQTPAFVLNQVLFHYLELGIKHVLGGLDHLAFVIGLTIAASSTRRILKLVSVFTLAHSLTLIISALYRVTLPTLLVEIVIALSVVYIGISIWRQHRYATYLPVTFVFGLIHGLGFAAVLATVGLPAALILPSLLSFNVGVELGQLAVVATVAALITCALRLKMPQPLLVKTTSLAITIAGFVWCIERIVSYI